MLLQMCDYKEKELCEQNKAIDLIYGNKYYFVILELLLCHIDLVSSATPLPYKYLSWS